MSKSLLQSSIDEQISGFLSRTFVALSRKYPAFERPVIEVWPTLREDYLSLVRDPISISEIQKKIKKGADNSYTMVGEVLADLNRVTDNCILFNGERSDLGKESITMRKEWYSKCSAYAASKGFTFPTSETKLLGELSKYKTESNDEEMNEIIKVGKSNKGASRGPSPSNSGGLSRPSRTTSVDKRSATPDDTDYEPPKTKKLSTQQSNPPNPPKRSPSTGQKANVGTKQAQRSKGSLPTEGELAKMSPLQRSTKEEMDEGESSMGNGIGEQIYSNARKVGIARGNHSEGPSPIAGQGAGHSISPGNLKGVQSSSGIKGFANGSISPDAVSRTMPEATLKDLLRTKPMVLPQTQHDPTREPTPYECRRLGAKMLEIESATLRRILMGILQNSAMFVDPEQDLVVMDFVNDLKPYFWVLYEKVMKARAMKSESE